MEKLIFAQLSSFIRALGACKYELDLKLGNTSNILLESATNLVLKFFIFIVRVRVKQFFNVSLVLFEI